jgi:hypothetical protein
MHFGVCLPNMGVCGSVGVLADLALDADVGATWWIEAVWQIFFEKPGDLEAIRERIEQGPPE